MTLSDALEEGGFTVVEAATAGQAIAMLQDEGASYRALLTDVNLGSRHLTGWEVARAAREINQDVPVVDMTGDSGNEWAAKGVPQRPAHQAIRARPGRHGCVAPAEQRGSPTQPSYRVGALDVF